jgi:hypothetical protein
VPLEPRDFNGTKQSNYKGGDSVSVEAASILRPSPLSKCELCASYVGPDRMRKHISKVHGPPLDIRLSKQPIPPSATARTKQNG